MSSFFPLSTVFSPPTGAIQSSQAKGDELHLLLFQRLDDPKGRGRRHAWCGYACWIKAEEACRRGVAYRVGFERPLVVVKVEPHDDGNRCNHQSADHKQKRKDPSVPRLSPLPRRDPRHPRINALHHPSYPRSRTFPKPWKAITRVARNQRMSPSSPRGGQLMTRARSGKILVNLSLDFRE